MEHLSPGQIIFLFMMGAWVILAVSGHIQHGKREDRAHRERLAMIEKGMVPPPELYPDTQARTAGAWGLPLPPPSSPGAQPGATWIKLGLLMIGVGIGIAWVPFILGQTRGA